MRVVSEFMWRTAGEQRRRAEVASRGRAGLHGEAAVRAPRAPCRANTVPRVRGRRHKPDMDHSIRIEL